MRKFIVVLLLVFTTILTSYSQDITGTWKGELNVFGQKLDLFFTFTKGEEGRYSATMDIPMQGVKDLPVEEVKFEKLVLELNLTALGASYKGTYVINGFVGDFSQGGMAFKLNLLRGEITAPKRPQEPKPPYPYHSEEVKFSNTRDNITLAGTLTLPEGAGPFPAVVMITGSGYQNRDEELFGHKPFHVIADYLTRRGIAVLRYDDRGVGESGGSTQGNTSEDLSYDAQAALSFLTTRGDISKVGLCGHSEGGTIAFMLGAREPKTSFIVSLAGTGVNGAEVLISQTRAISKLMGVSEEYLASSEKINKSIYDVIFESDKNDPSLKEKCMARVRQNSTSPINEEAILKGIDNALDPWFYYFIKYSPYEAIKSIKIPILALNGDKDIQVIPSINIPAIIKACEEGGNKSLTTKVLPGLNHLFQHCTTGNINEYASIEETISEEVLEIIAEWIISLK